MTDNTDIEKQKALEAARALLAEHEAGEKAKASLAAAARVETASRRIAAIAQLQDRLAGPVAEIVSAIQAATDLPEAQRTALASHLTSLGSLDAMLNSAAAVERQIVASAQGSN